MHKNRYIYITLLAVIGFSTEGLHAQEKINYAPRLVVNITVDQLRSDYLEAFSPLYGNGGFKRLLKEGLVYDNASYPFSTIDRASGAERRPYGERRNSSRRCPARSREEA